MNRIINFQTISLLALMTLGSLFIQCTKKEGVEPNPPPSLPEKVNYFPTSFGSKYIYINGSTEMGLYDLYDTIKFTIKESLEESNKSYVMVYDKPIRVENGNYYIWTSSELFIGEHVFLKDNMPKGSSWGHTEGFQEPQKFYYTIQEIHATKEVNGKMYNNVIEVLEEIFWKNPDNNYALSQSITHFYANNIGEIYWYENHNSDSKKLRKSKLVEHTIN